MPAGQGGALLGQFPLCPWPLSPAEGHRKVVVQHSCLAPKALGGSGLQRAAQVVKSGRLAEREPGAATEPERPRRQWEAKFSGEPHRALRESGRIRVLTGQKACRRTV